MAEPSFATLRRPFPFQSFADQISQFRSASAAGFDFLALPSVMAEDEETFEPPIPTEQHKRMAMATEFTPMMFGQFDGFKAREMPQTRFPSVPTVSNRTAGLSQHQQVPVVNVMPPTNASKLALVPQPSAQISGGLKQILQNVNANNSGIIQAANPNFPIASHLQQGQLPFGERPPSSFSKNLVTGITAPKLDQSAQKTQLGFTNTPFKQQPGESPSKIENRMAMDPLNLLNLSRQNRLGPNPALAARNQHIPSLSMTNTFQTHLMAKKISEKCSNKNDAARWHVRSRTQPEVSEGEVRRQ